MLQLPAMNVVLFCRSRGRIYAPGKLQGVQEIAKKNGWHVQTVDGPISRRRVAELKAFWNPIGAIVERGGEHSDADTGIFGDLPVVFFAHNPKTLPPHCFLVTHDSAETARSAARELMATGFENFAFIPYEKRLYWNEERRKAFVDAIRLNGKKCSVFSPQPKSTGQTARQRELRRFLSSLEKPVAVFAATDITASETITAARFEGISIPNELVIIGVDNYEHICEHTIPPLSSIEPDYKRGGQLAMMMLMDILRAKDRSALKHHLTFGPRRTVHRATSRTLSVNDRTVLEALELIRREACSGLSATEVVDTFGCSRRLAYLRFKKATGRSVLEHIHLVQLERAKELLRDTGQQLKSISDFCGFSNPNSLRKFFKRETGMTLSEWRTQA